MIYGQSLTLRRSRLGEGDCTTHACPTPTFAEAGSAEVFTAPAFIDFHRMCVSEAKAHPEMAVALGRGNVSLVEVGEWLVGECQSAGLIGPGDASFLMRQLAQASSLRRF